MSQKYWTTREGVRLEISKMATPHLLATIHMIERNRMQNLISIGLMGVGQKADQDIIDYYAQWPESYDALCEEAERRCLIHRGTQREGLTRRK